MKLANIGYRGRLGFDLNVNKTEREFIKKLIERITRECYYFYHKTNKLDHLFTYRERQFNSAVCPAISRVAYAFIMQHPLKRKPRGEASYSGRLDYWLNYGDRDFMLELKHDYFCYRPSSLGFSGRKSIVRKFNDAIKQLKIIKRDECRNIAISDYLNKVVLAAIVFYRRSRYDDFDIKEEINETLFKNMLEYIAHLRGYKEVVNLKALWILNKSLVKSFELNNGRYEIYPAIGFIGHVFDKESMQSEPR